MTQDRNRSFFHLLFSPLRRARNRDGSDADDTSVEESRRKLEQRIEMALANPIEPDERDTALNSAA
jgi:hypothetical protein